MQQLDYSGHKHFLQREERNKHVALIRGFLIPSGNSQGWRNICLKLFIRVIIFFGIINYSISKAVITAVAAAFFPAQ